MTDSCISTILWSLAAIFYPSKSKQSTARKIVQFWLYSLFVYFSLYVQYTSNTCLLVLTFKCPVIYINAIDRQSNLSISLIYISPTCGCMRNNSGTVLKLELIVGNLSFVFQQSTYRQVHVLFFVWKPSRLTYIMILSVAQKWKFLTVSKPHYYLR